ncbi:gastric triacylglycerol lipase-like [Ornithodoros turicata]|uniref:gastric triacylglycerol lipase-like n=1 Tax=Ornithodoros turicata TaxID=34597 RepID=UPI003139231F
MHCAPPSFSCNHEERLVTGKGYPFERHLVTTKDGYIIEMHRIPHGRKPCQELCHRTPVFLMTGLMADSTTFVLDFPEQSLGFVLPDNGYDLWLGNTRGTAFGRRHKIIGARSRDFWNFSFHEHAIYDATAEIDYILENRKAESLLYVGLSQGTLMFFTLLSENPSYNKKIRAFAGLAPFRKLAHIRVAGLNVIKPYMRRFLVGFEHAGVLELGHNRYPGMKAVRTICALPFRRVCAVTADTFGNLGSKYMNISRFPVYLCYLPSGTSVKNLMHYEQLVAGKKAQKFDYGAETNMDVYGQEEPPEYNLDNVKTDVGLFWSKGDQFIPPEDVEELVADLGERVKKAVFIDDTFYTHADFAVALNNPTVLYGELLEFLGRYIS